MLVLVTGGTGFVGKNMVQGLVDKRYTVRCLSRSADEPPSPAINAVQFVKGDVRDLESLNAAMQGVDAVIHLVGIIREEGDQTFQRVHVEGTLNLLLAMKENGVKRLLHMSALGTREGAESKYHKTKWEAEEAVRNSGLDWTIFRPSIIVGEGDGFTHTLVDLVKKGPVVPVIGSGEYKMQPVAIEDVVFCFIKSFGKPDYIHQTYELCGSQALAFDQILDEVMSVLNIQKSKVHIPSAAVSPVVGIIEKVLPHSPVTSDQLIMLGEDNVCTSRAVTDVFGVTPKPFGEKIREFLHQ